MRNVLLILIINVLFVGCSIFPEPILVKNYTLNCNTDNISSNKTNKVLRVTLPRGPSNILSSGIFYSNQDGREEAYKQHRWSEQLSEIINQSLVQTLSKNAAFAGVIDTRSRINYDLILETRVYSAIHYIRDDESWIEFSMGFSLVDRETKKIVSSKELFQKIDVEQKNISSVVYAFNKAWCLISHDMLVWLDGVK